MPAAALIGGTKFSYVAITSGIEWLVFFDSAKAGESIFGFEVIPDLSFGDFRSWKHIVAIGDNARRMAVFAELTNGGSTFTNIIAPDATIGLDVKLGQGNFIGRGAHIGPLASMGDNTIINTHAVVDHESTIGSHSHVAVHAVIAGRCDIGEHVFIGAAATVIDGIQICAETTIGAGAVVVKDTHAPGIYVGVPAAPILSHQKAGNEE